jgi:hypothetical protein
MQQSHKKQQLQQPSLTVEQWLGLEPLSIQDINRQKRQSYSNKGGEKEVVVELLVEVRVSPASKWIREPLELENRLQVSIIFSSVFVWFGIIPYKLARIPSL